MLQRKFDQIADPAVRGPVGTVRQRQGMSPVRSQQIFCARTSAALHDLLMHQLPLPAGAELPVEGPAEKPVLQEPESGAASVRRHLGVPPFILILKPGQVSLDHDPFDEPGNAVQIRPGIKVHRLLPPRVIAVGNAALLRRTIAGAANAQRMPFGRRDGHAILDPQFVLPPAPHVVDVAELRIPAKPEIRQGQVHLLAAQIRPGMHDAPDAELNEVDCFPSHRHLKHAVKFVQRHGFRNRKAPPDHRIDSQQSDFQLQSGLCIRHCPGIRHAIKLQEALHNASYSRFSAVCMGKNHGLSAT